MINFLVRRAGFATALLLLTIVAAFAYRPVVRTLSTPAELRLAPADAAALIFVPSIQELGENLHSHLCSLDNTDPSACPFVSGEEGMDELSPFTAYQLLWSLRSYGIDTRQPAMLAWRGPLTAGDFVLVMSLESSPESCQQMATYLENSAEYFEFEQGGLCPVIADDKPNGKGETDNGLPVFVKTLNADTGSARKLVAFYTNAAAFNLILAQRNGGEHLLSQDGFADAYRTMVQDQRASAWGFARQPGFAPLAPSAFALTFEDTDPAFMPDATRALGRKALAEELAYFADGNEMEPAAAQGIIKDLSESASFVAGAQSARLSLWVAPSVLYSRNLSGLLTAEPGQGVASGLDSGAGASIFSRELMEFIRFADYAFPATLPTFLFHGQDSTLGSQASIFEALLRETMQLESVDGIDAQLVGFQDRVPNLVVRLSISEPESQRLVRRIQASEQQRRDIALVNAALGRNADTAVDPAEARSLVERGVIRVEAVPGGMKHLLLAATDDAAFETAVANDPLNSDCLAGEPSKEGIGTCSAGQRIVYLQPPLNANDLDIRLGAQSGNTSLRNSLLVGQRFRAVAAYDVQSEMLWIATDRNVLAQHFARALPAQTAGRPWLSMRMQPDNLYTQMKAQGFDKETENERQRSAAGLVRRLSVYDQVTLSAESLGDNRGTRIDLELSH